MFILASNREFHLKAAVDVQLVPVDLDIYLVSFICEWSVGTRRGSARYGEQSLMILAFKYW